MSGGCGVSDRDEILREVYQPDLTNFVVREENEERGP